MSEIHEEMQKRYKNACVLVKNGQYEQYILEIDLDGVWGYPSSFVSGSFGKLSVKYDSKTVLKYIQFKSDESSIRKEKIISDIQNPRKND